MVKKCETGGTKYKYRDCFLKYPNFKDDLIKCKCLFCNKICLRKFDEKLKKRFFNSYKFSNNDNNKFILLLRKGVYPYKYIDNLEKVNKTSLPEKEVFYSHSNMEDIIDADYAQAKRVCKDFEIKSCGEYHDFYVRSDTLLLTDVLENLRNMCLEIYEFDPGKSFSAPGLAWQAALKKTKVKLDILIDIDLLLMVEKGITGGISPTLFINMQRLITNT